MKKLFVVGLLVVLVLGVGSAAQAQSAPRVVLSGFDTPRGLCIADDGTLYVADAGRGGDVTVNGVFGAAQAGGTAAVYAVAPDGTRSTVVYGLPSINANGEVLGVHDVYAADGALWLLTGQNALPGPGTANNPFSYALVEVDAVTLRVKTFVDLYSFEVENNPDGEAIDSNPVKMAASDDGTIYIADAGANAVLKWVRGEGLSVFATWSDNPVPTSVDVAADGSVFIGFLTGFPFPTEGARIEQYAPDGTLQATFTGLTTVVDVLVAADGTLYATQLAVFDPNAGWVPNSGSVVAVAADGLTPIASELNFPYALGETLDGALLVTVNSVYAEPGTGGIAIVRGDWTYGGAAPEPAATESAG